MNQIRQENILELITKKRVISINELQSLFPDVSFMTIHRDLAKLEQEGHIVKIRGGARLISHKTEALYEERTKEQVEGKRIIAEKAITLIQKDSCVFLDSGTTILAIVRSLPDIPLTIFTTSPGIAIELRHLSKVSINICGGKLNPSTVSLSGFSTLKTLEDINIDLAFLGVSGCSADSGFTCGQESEMMVKQKVIEKTKTAVVVFDHTKLNRLLPFTFATVDDIDRIITDEPLPEDFIYQIKEAKVALL